MENIVNSTTGLMHLIASIIAMATGMLVLASPKGTSRHKTIGYIYTLSIITLNVTAFIIYELYGKFGVFHALAVVSSLTLIAGIYPMITKNSKNYIQTHMIYMYWSVIGLYCAFMAELFSRLPKILFTDSEFNMNSFYIGVFIGTAVVMFIGVWYYKNKKPIWLEKYNLKSVR